MLFQARGHSLSGLAAFLVVVCGLLFPPLFSQPSYENYHLVWSDEFDGNGLPDTKNWNYEKGCSVRNSELQNYTEKRLENAHVEEGFLTIEARKESMGGCDYTAASLITRGKQEFQYGLFEMRAKIDVRKGSWPAFWTLGVSEEWPSNGEIDIMEYYNSQLHANVAWGTDTRWQAHWDSQTKAVSSSFSDDFHIWRMLWTEDSIKLYVDDFLQNTTALSQTINGSLATLKNPFRQKVYIVINQAVGANGGDPSGTAFPVKFIVDYVRVYQEGSDTTPPAIAAVSASSDGSVRVVYTERVEKKSAETIGNYTVNNGAVTIIAAVLEGDGRTAVLSTAPLAIGSEVQVTVKGIRDNAAVPNLLTSAMKTAVVVRESTRLTGTVVGNGTPWNGTSGVGYENVLDGLTSTYADCTGDVVWAGYDFGTDSNVVITSVRYWPRSGYADRMAGRTVEVSMDGIIWKNILTIAAAPPEETFTTADVADAPSARFVRYNGSGGYLNAAEVEFWGYRESAVPIRRKRNTEAEQLSIGSYKAVASLKLFSVNGVLLLNMPLQGKTDVPTTLQKIAVKEKSAARGVHIAVLEDAAHREVGRFLLQYPW